jgi:hypothetical protein
MFQNIGIGKELSDSTPKHRKQKQKQTNGIIANLKVSLQLMNQ